MEFPVKTGAPTDQKTACAILPLFEDRRLRGASKEIDDAGKNVISDLVRFGDACGKLGSTLLVPRTGLAAERLLLVGCGKFEEFDAKRLTTALGAAAHTLKGTGIKEAISYLAYDPIGELSLHYAARLSVETMRTSLYRFEELKSRAEPKLKLSRLTLAVRDRQAATEARRGVVQGTAIADGMDLTRDLGNRPANVCTPSHLASVARGVGQRHANLRVRVLSEADMKRLRMGALLSVTQGAVEPARLIVMEYRGADPRIGPVALCGKGVTFDTGGISLKPPAKMDEMKFDMCGAAAVIGTMETLGKLQPKLNAVAIVPACENMPSGKATRPGDIIRSMSGQTVEVVNTDAEGRLILCDALSYARRFRPQCILDVATLTGACIVALGHVYTGLFTNDEPLASALIEAGRRSLDPVWRLPLGEEYGETLKSNFADFANSGTRDGGASVAANFLSRFVDGQRWAHLDIAGVAWRSDAAKGATGRPVPLLTDFLLDFFSK